METTFISNCCKQVIKLYDTEGNPVEVCPKCKHLCELEEVCAFCLGTGEVPSMERVYPGEPHMADIGTRKCICQVKEYDGDGEDD